MAEPKERPEPGQKKGFFTSGTLYGGTPEQALAGPQTAIVEANVDVAPVPMSTAERVRLWVYENIAGVTISQMPGTMTAFILVHLQPQCGPPSDEMATLVQREMNWPGSTAYLRHYAQWPGTTPSPPEPAENSEAPIPISDPAPA